MSTTPGELPGLRLDRFRSHVEPHDHAICTYATDEELHVPLAAFLEEGLARKELNVLVHAYEDDAQAWTLLERAHPGADKLRADELVVVSVYRDAFEAKRGRIDYEHVTGVVESLIESARARGRAGVRIFVDASRVYLGGGRADEWFAFEEWLGRRLQSSVGLVCAYRRDDVMRPEVLPRVLQTHTYRFDAPDRS